MASIHSEYHGGLKSEMQHSAHELGCEDDEKILAVAA